MIKSAGKYRIKTLDSRTGEVKEVSPWIKNLIVSSDTHGLNLIGRQLIGDSTYPLEITQAKIGTGDTAPSLAQTDLQTPVLSGILRATQVVSDNEVTIEFFISDLELPNGEYKEFGIFCGNQMFARSLIYPTFTKSSNEDTLVEYVIEFNNI